VWLVLTIDACVAFALLRLVSHSLLLLFLPTLLLRYCMLARAQARYT